MFYMLKKRFRILEIAPEYSMDIQVRIPPAMVVLHNIIRTYDPGDVDNFDMPDLVNGDEWDSNWDGEDEDGEDDETEAETEANVRRDQIAAQMWADYQVELRRRGAIEI
ncbi:hypothetical protein BJ138DRAFT_297641 [Hygrophoropsis aurantiaca]|uniref:Uncharacterized protein n=1 Tax=Hygrophoropsis aurantiaca TaxID=72124 RepID=A0ACB8AN70_9AGAM|nr:hypothetical protein BJ138DRAFT_297641 [Hygrophoropsis aurantiaca]